MKNLKCCGERADTQDVLCGILLSRIGPHFKSRCGELPALPDAEEDERVRVVPISVEYRPQEATPANRLQRSLPCAVLAEVDRTPEFFCLGRPSRPKPLHESAPIPDELPRPLRPLRVRLTLSRPLRTSSSRTH